MSKLSLGKKLAIFWQVSKSSYLFLIVIAALLILGFIFYTTNKKNYKKRKVVYLLSSAVILALMIIFYHGSLANIFDYMMNNLFIAIYFPNLAIYFAAIIIMNIILWTSLFDFRTSEIIKKINIVVYVIINYLLALLLSVINSNKLDIFKQTSIYGNNKARAIIELTSFVFVIWIVFLILYKLFLIYIRKDYKPKVKKVIVKKRVKKLPDNFIPITAPDAVIGKARRKDTKVSFKAKNVKVNKHKDDKIVAKTKEEPKSLIEEMIEERKNKKSEVVVTHGEQVISAPVDSDKNIEITIKKEEPVEKPEIISSENINQPFEQMLTVEDYKLLLRMLQEQKEKDKLEKERLEQIAKEEDKFGELEALYRSTK